MASSSKLDDDDYVAKLLVEDAKKSSLRYAQQGLSALLPRRATGAAPRPNTRFLKTIVREADSHNAALKKKEELEARIRQRELRERSRNDCATDCRRDENDRPLKRRRCSNDEGPFRSMRRLERRNRSSDKSKTREWRQSSSRHGSSNENTLDRCDHGSLRHRRRQGSRSSSESRATKASSRGAIPGRTQAESGHLKQRHRSWSSRSTPSEDEKTNKKPTKGENMRGKRSIVIGDSRSKNLADYDSESDPLEALVGPLERLPEDLTTSQVPPLRSKGRGAYKVSGAAMDAHFSLDYNPSVDLHPESELEDEKEDWDMALEALRDREMFKQKQSERLRAAGFGEVEIKKWEGGVKDKDIQDFKWASKGQAREWDIGKADQDVIRGRSDDSERIGSEASWKRKDGGV